MAFDTHHEQATVTDIELEEKRASVLHDIHQYGVKLDEIRTEIDTHQRLLVDKKKELESIHFQIKAIIPTLDSEKRRLADVQLEIERLQQIGASLSGLEGENSNKQSKLGALRREITSLEVNKHDLQVSVSKLHTDIESLQMKHSDTYNGHEFLIKQKNEELKKLQVLIVETQEKLDEFIQKKQVLEEEVGSLTSIIGFHSNSITQLKKDIEIAKNELANTRNQNEIAKTNVISEIERLKKDIIERETAIIKREGACSLKESWLLDKQKQLRDIKAEVEKHLGRKIPVTVPNEDVI